MFLPQLSISIKYKKVWNKRMILCNMIDALQDLL